MTAGLLKAKSKKKKRRQVRLSHSRNPAKAVESAPANKMAGGCKNKSL